VLRAGLCIAKTPTNEFSSLNPYHVSESPNYQSLFHKTKLMNIYIPRQFTQFNFYGIPMQVLRLTPAVGLLPVHYAYTQDTTEAFCLMLNSNSSKIWGCRIVVVIGFVSGRFVMWLNISPCAFFGISLLIP
jgi:hypothetical protein